MNGWWSALLTDRGHGSQTLSALPRQRLFMAVTPTALIRRALGKDSLRLSFEREAKSYWIARDTAPRSSMHNQF